MMARQISWRGLLSPDAGDGRHERAAWRPATAYDRPRSIVEAVRAMQVGAVLSGLEILRAFLTRGALRDAFAREAAVQGKVASAADLDQLVSISLTITTVAGLAAATLWWSMSRATERGSKWGRLLASGLLAVAFGVFFGGLLPTAGLLSRTMAAVLLMVGVFAVVRLWHRDSSAYIRYRNTIAPD
jgi:hypothetical protein